MALAADMAPQRAVTELDIHPRIHAALKRGARMKQITPLDSNSSFSPLPAGLHQLSSVLVYSSSDLVRRTGLSVGDTAILLSAASRALLHSPHTALDLYQRATQEGGGNWGRSPHTTHQRWRLEGGERIELEFPHPIHPN